MKIWKDANGKWIDRKEFFSRWKEGMKKISPIQQTKVTLFKFAPLMIGIIWGIISSIILKTYWLVTLLVGSLVITGVQLFVNIQKFIMLKEFEREVTQDEDFQN